MTRAVWEALLDAVQTAHSTHDAVRAFCPLPTDLQPQEVQPHAIPAAALLDRETDLTSDCYGDLRDACVAAAPLAHWRETYRGTDIGADFLDRFACFCLIGPNGAFTSRTMHGFLVYMPANLWYPWHHHPAEEMYLVIAGEAEFLGHGTPPRTLRPGDTALHGAGEPHATRTRDHPVMAYVVWRNGFGIPPVLTPPGMLQ